MEDDKPIELRDKLAIEILNGLLASNQNAHDGTPHGIVYGIGLELIASFSGDQARQDYGINLAEQYCRAAYRIADIMRRVRMQAFE